MRKRDGTGIVPQQKIFIIKWYKKPTCCNWKLNCERTAWSWCVCVFVFISKILFLLYITHNLFINSNAKDRIVKRIAITEREAQKERVS